MNRRELLKLGTLATLASSTSMTNAARVTATDARNVLFLAVDDMNDWIGCLGGHPDTRTPNLDRLAQNGVLFTNAHTPAPYCNPARCSIMSGMRPDRSGIYYGETLQAQLPNVATITEHFMQQGYDVTGAGKVFHLERNKTENRWHEFTHFPRATGEQKQYPPLNGIKEFSRADSLDWGAVDMAEHEFADWSVANWAIAELEKPHYRPFFLGVGFFHPHLPWYVPEKYLARFPPDRITLPLVPADDLVDLPPFARNLAEKSMFPMPDNQSDHERIVAHGQWRNAVSCYLGAISYVDMLIGRVADALAISRHADNTILVIWSDGGFHLREKQHWRKFSLWERGTRSPLLVIAPGITHAGTRCARPVSLTDIFPTLLEMTGLPPPSHPLDGHSLVPLLRDPVAEWEHVALTTHMAGNHSIRSQQWRYIKYKDGLEELYDHEVDPMEWNNLAYDSTFFEIKRQLSIHVPGNGT